MPMSETDYVNSLLASARCKPVDREKEYALFLRFKAGDPKAGNRLVEVNLRFVRGVAIGLINRGLTFSELMQEGAIGLRMALSRHNPERMVDGQRIKFITYAVWWVRQRMMIAIAEQAHPIKIPAGFASLAGKVERARRKLEQNLGRTATPDEVAEAARTTVERIAEVLGPLGHSQSLNEPTTGDGHTEGIELLQGVQEADQAISGNQERTAIESLIDKLEPRDQDIIRRRFGIGRPRETLREIGERYNLSRERVRQREGSVMPILRKAARKMDIRIA